MTGDLLSALGVLDFPMGCEPGGDLPRLGRLVPSRVGGASAGTCIPIGTRVSPGCLLGKCLVRRSLHRLDSTRYSGHSGQAHTRISLCSSLRCNDLSRHRAPGKVYPGQWVHSWLGCTDLSSLIFVSVQSANAVSKGSSGIRCVFFREMGRQVLKGRSP